jgi:hypothetical protein
MLKIGYILDFSFEWGIEGSFDHHVGDFNRDRLADMDDICYRKVIQVHT